MGGPKIGVYWNKSRNKWQVQRFFDGKNTSGGMFCDLNRAKRESDNLVYEYEKKIGQESTHQLNFPRLLKNCAYERESKYETDANKSLTSKRKRCTKDKYKNFKKEENYSGVLTNRL